MKTRGQGDRTGHPFTTFLLASLPGWIVAVVAAVVLYRSMAVPLWAAGALVVVLIATDLLTFPRQRRFYESQPSGARIVGEEGVAVSELAPEGFVRVHGELWQARTPDKAVAIRKGARLRVREIHGLELVVEPTDECRAPMQSA